MSVDNRLTQLFEKKRKGVLAVFLTAGYPTIEDAAPICEALEKAGADIIELGFPYSDSLVDGETIQMSNAIALENGMTLKAYFEVAAAVREKTSLPLVFMGCLNPILQYGIDRFYRDCQQSGIDGLIIPDLPCPEYVALHQEVAERNNLSMVFLITSRTSDDRIREFDNIGNGFLYAVSSDTTTGQVLEVDSSRKEYFDRLQSLKLKTPVMVGFGISDAESFQVACQHASGAIIGSAFLRALSGGGDVRQKSRDFVEGIRR